MIGWVFVFFAAVCEVIGVIGLKLFSQKKSIKSGVLYGGGFALSFAFLYQSFKYLQVSISYAVWVGIGTAGAVLINMLLFGESKNKERVFSLLLIIIGVVGLKALS